MAANSHVQLSDNPYHYSFNLCANSSFNNDSKEEMQRSNQFQSSYYSNYLNNSNESEFHCDLCDRSFKNDGQLRKHVDEHTTCGINGCQFTAHPKIIANHVRMQHHTGIYNQIKKLDNPEEVKKWIAERKRKYPTQKNIENQIKLEAAKKKRGETIEPDNSRFNRDFRQKRNNWDRSGSSRGKKKNRKPKTKPRPNSFHIDVEIPEKAISNGDIPLFRGIGRLERKEEEEKVQPEELDFNISDDDEVINQPSSTDTSQFTNKSLALLMTSYNSGEDSEDEAITFQPTTQPPKLTPCTMQEVIVDDDNGPPEEVKTIVDSKPMQYPDHEEINPRKRKNAFKNNPRQLKDMPKNMQLRPRKPTLLQKLLCSQIEHERKVILECVHYIVKNKFFDNHKINRNNKVKGQNKKEMKKPNLLGGLLKDDIIRERNTILQCIRHVTNNNFFLPQS